MIGREELFQSIDCALLDHVDELASAVVPLARESLRVLVGKRSSHRLEHGRRHEILARDELEAAPLARHLQIDKARDLRIAMREVTDGHRNLRWRFCWRC